jgi:hypothetical protein
MQVVTCTTGQKVTSVKRTIQEDGALHTLPLQRGVINPVLVFKEKRSE